MRFKVFVQNVAKIKEAEIELAPLTIFVGENNTNKSYISQIIYMLYKIYYKPSISLDFMETIEKFRIEREGLKIEIFNLLKEIKRIYKANSLECITHPKYKDLILRLAEKLEEIFKNYFIPYRIKKAFFFHPSFKDIYIKANIFENLKEEIFKALYRRSSLSWFFYSIIEDVSKEEEIEQIIKYLIIEIFLKRPIRFNYNIYYLPASRTGFILAYDEILLGVLRKQFSGKEGSKLTEPTIDFLLNLSHRWERNLFSFAEKIKRKKYKQEIKKLIDFVKKFEREFLKGEIIVEKKEGEKKFKFKIPDTGTELDLFLVSSSVTETAPLFIILQEDLNTRLPIKKTNSLLIIEEPEAHLHPKNQRIFIRFLTNLIEFGYQILITTHSDYIVSELNLILQQNNLLKKCPEKGQLLKSKNYLLPNLSPEDVNVYWFKETNSKVEVKKLPITEKGIEAQNFDEVLDDLTEQIYKVEEFLEECQYEKKTKG
jgi:predicted ATPase